MVVIICEYVSEGDGRSTEWDMSLTEEKDSVLVVFKTKAKAPLQMAKAKLKKGCVETLLYAHPDRSPTSFVFKGQFVMAENARKGVWRGAAEAKTFTAKIISDEEKAMFLDTVAGLVERGKIDSLDDMKTMA